MASLVGEEEECDGEMRVSLSVLVLSLGCSHVIVSKI